MEDRAEATSEDSSWRSEAIVDHGEGAFDRELEISSRGSTTELSQCEKHFNGLGTYCGGHGIQTERNY
jgi:hypothetical protein